MAQAVRSDPSGTEAAAGERYLLLADISGYTGFMSGVEEEHGLDFSGGIPAAYPILADLLDSVVEGVSPDLALVKLEGDAVFAAAPAAGLDGQGDRVLETIHGTYRAFIAARTRAIPAHDHSAPRVRRRVPRPEGDPPSRTGRPPVGRDRAATCSGPP